MKEREFPERKELYFVGGIAALLIGVIFILGIIASVGDQPKFIARNNFLTLIFKLHAGYSGVEEELLDVFSLWDISIIVLVGIFAFALYATLKQANRTGAIIAVIMPIIGLSLYLITHEIGRTAIMPAGLAIAVVMLFSDKFRKSTAYLGITGNTLLLIGDIGALSYARIFAVSIGIGYLLFMLWCFLTARRLFKLGFGE